jgi:DNA-binding transcriptional regulator of glucitol operon
VGFGGWAHVRDDRGVERAALVVVVAAVAVAVAFVVQRRRAVPAPTNTGHVLPDRLDRGDFARPQAPWLVAVFTSATCSTCAGVWSKAEMLASDAVAVQQLEAVADRELHGKYGVTAVPGVVVADGAGVVRARFLGPVTATDLWATLAELRSPGTLPAEGCDHGLGATG